MASRDGSWRMPRRVIADENSGPGSDTWKPCQPCLADEEIDFDLAALTTRPVALPLESLVPISRSVVAQFPERSRRSGDGTRSLTQGCPFGTEERSSAITSHQPTGCCAPGVCLPSGIRWSSLDGRAEKGQNGAVRVL
jgi:hypothetical protein